MAFSEEENRNIREALFAEAKARAMTVGTRKTSVEELTNAVGISKGSFYKFYDSKELLFFVVLESIHTELYRVAKKHWRRFPPILRAKEQRKPCLPYAAGCRKPEQCISSKRTPNTSCAGFPSR